LNIFDIEQLNNIFLIKNDLQALNSRVNVPIRENRSNARESSQQKQCRLNPFVNNVLPKNT